MQCTKCRTEEFNNSPIIINPIEGAEGDTGEYCFHCGMEELRKRLKGVPFSIELPPEGTSAAINYTAEFVE